MIGIKTLRFEVQLNKLDNSQMVLSPLVVGELLDRLEAAEKAVTEAYQRGYATGQEEIEKERDALRAKIEAMEKERDELRAKLERLYKDADKFGDGIDWIQRALQAEACIEAMERQEPVAEIGQQYTLLFVGSGSMTELVKRHGIKIGTKLYALPGAKGE